MTTKLLLEMELSDREQARFRHMSTEDIRWELAWIEAHEHAVWLAENDLWSAECTARNEPLPWWRWW